MNEFKCNAPGCEIKFDNLLDFEIHYNSCHRFTCAECKKINANARLLEIHIEENHDSFFKVLADKKPMVCTLSCLLLIFFQLSNLNVLMNFIVILTQ